MDDKIWHHLNSCDWLKKKKNRFLSVGNCNVVHFNYSSAKWRITMGLLFLQVSPNFKPEYFRYYAFVHIMTMITLLYTLYSFIVGIYFFFFYNWVWTSYQHLPKPEKSLQNTRFYVSSIKLRGKPNNHLTSLGDWLGTRSFEWGRQSW